MKSQSAAACVVGSVSLPGGFHLSPQSAELSATLRIIIGLFTALISGLISWSDSSSNSLSPAFCFEAISLYFPSISLGTRPRVKTLHSPAFVCPPAAIMGHYEKRVVLKRPSRRRGVWFLRGESFSSCSERSTVRGLGSLHLPECVTSPLCFVEILDKTLSWRSLSNLISKTVRLPEMAFQTESSLITRDTSWIQTTYGCVSLFRFHSWRGSYLQWSRCSLPWRRSASFGAESFQSLTAELQETTQHTYTLRRAEEAGGGRV